MPAGYLTWNPQYDYRNIADTSRSDYRNIAYAPPSSSYNDYATGALCRVPPRSSYQIYGQPSAGDGYLSNHPRQQPYSPSPARYPYQRKINTIAEEERQRILSIRRDQEEERKRARALQEDHHRLLRLRAERGGRPLPPEPRVVERRNERRREPPRVNPDLPVQAQVAQVVAIERMRNTRPDDFDWNEMLDEIRRPPPDYNNVNVMRSTNESSVSMLRQDVVPVSGPTRAEIKNAEKRKELYDRNIASVNELSGYKSEEPCSVCYDDESENMLIMVCCKQYFCFACISAWWKEKKTCPACRVSDPVFVEITGKKSRETEEESPEKLEEKLDAGLEESLDKIEEKFNELE